MGHFATPGVVVGLLENHNIWWYSARVDLAALLIALGALAACAYACVYCRGAVAVTRQGTPAQLLQVAEALTARVLAVENNLEAFGGKLTSWRVEMDGVEESIEDALGRIERKRSSISSAESRRKRADGGNGNDIPSLTQRAREQGLLNDG